MLKQTSCKYFIVGNATFTFEELFNLDDQTVTDIVVSLPESFKNYKGKKYIKFYGCTVAFLVHDTSSEQIEQTYTPLHTTLHSNITNMTNTEGYLDRKSIVFNEEHPSLHLNDYTDYVSTTNNYLNQKIYCIPDTVTELKFYFLDQYGRKIKILNIEHSIVENDDGSTASVVETKVFKSFQTLYKIEMELIKD
jgi:hypothetical protein